MTGTIFRHLFPVDGPSLIDGRHLSNLFGLVVPVQRSIKHHHELKIHLSDYVLCLDLNFEATIHLPPAHGRRGKPLRFVDVGNKCGRHPVTLKPTWHGSRHERRKDRIINWPTEDLVMGTDGEIVTLWPFWDQTNHGWFVYPQPTGAGSTVVGDRPPPNPDIGTTWWDSRDGQLYVWTGRQWVAASCCDDGIAVGRFPPDQPSTGHLWFDDNSKQLFVFDGHQWVAASCCDGAIPIGSRPPTQPLSGWQWWDTDSKQLYVYSGREWVAASCCDNAIEVGFKPPFKPLKGWQWWDTDSKQLFVYSGQEWVAASCCEAIPTQVSLTPPGQPLSGWMWFDTTSGHLFVWNGSAWIEPSCCPQPEVFTEMVSGLVPAPGNTILPTAMLQANGLWRVPGGNVTQVTGTYVAVMTDDLLVVNFPAINSSLNINLPDGSAGPAGKSLRVLIATLGANSTLTFAVQGGNTLRVMTENGWPSANQSPVSITAPNTVPINGLGTEFVFWLAHSGVWFGLNQGVPVEVHMGSPSALIELPGMIVPSTIPGAPFTNTANGLVPAPGAADPGTNVLMSNGQWGDPGTAVTLFTATIPGIVPATGGADNNHFLDADGTWAQPFSNLANNEVLGNISGAPAMPVGLTQAQLTQLINIFTQSAPGAVPVPGAGATINQYLRSDATWTVPGTSYAAGAGDPWGPPATTDVMYVTGATQVQMPAPAPNGRVIRVINSLSPNEVSFTTSGGAAFFINNANGWISLGTDFWTGISADKPMTELAFVAAGGAWYVINQGATIPITNAAQNAPQTMIGKLPQPRINVSTFLASGTYTPSAGLAYAIVECWGAGGGSGGCDIQSSGGVIGGSGGGGQGGYSRRALTTTQLGANQTVTIGPGGGSTDGGSGLSGGATSLGSLVIANGGAGGQGWTNNANGYGAGGAGANIAGAVGDLTLPGVAGTAASVTSFNVNSPSTSYIVTGGLGGGNSSPAAMAVGAIEVAGANGAINSGQGANGIAVGATPGNPTSSGAGGGSGRCVVTEFIL